MSKSQPRTLKPLSTVGDMPAVVEPGLHKNGFVPHQPVRPPKSEGGKAFELVADYKPAGDQPQAIAELVAGLNNKQRDQVLLGVTGSGKTFTMAQVIQKLQRPAIILAHNKTLAAQLYGEFKELFPHNAVEYFVSYYDYYQPEAYVPRSDTYIEKESDVNEQIDRMRHSATRAVLERDDVLIVASVSSIYGIGDVELYTSMMLDIAQGQELGREKLLEQLVALQYRRNNMAFARGDFRVRGDNIELFPAHYEERAWRIELFGNVIERLVEFDPLTGDTKSELPNIRIYANSHYVTPRPTLHQAVTGIRKELVERIAQFEAAGRTLEAQRLEQRTMFDIETMLATGSCHGIENYSRYLTGRKAGEPPPTLFEYLPDNSILFVDESHVTIPQLGGMFRGDFRRRATLANHGFRLASCVDNRPLRFEEWDAYRPQSIYVSATPGPWELAQTKGVFTEQVIRPTGLVDPICTVRPAKTQVDDLLGECRKSIAKGHRVLVTTLTKRMAEDLTEYMHEQGIKVRYLHSDIDTLERIEIVRDLRLGMFDVLIGINLLREGLDIPECGLVAILDADKEGFLRSEISLVQTIGRAARNAEGHVVLYADTKTGSLTRALQETERRRKKQTAHNKKHNITPASIRKNVQDLLKDVYGEAGKGSNEKLRSGEYGLASAAEILQVAEADTDAPGGNLRAHITDLRKQMHTAAEELEFETAARLRDEIKKLEARDLVIADDPFARPQDVHDAEANVVRNQAGIRKSTSKHRSGWSGRRTKPAGKPASKPSGKSSGKKTAKRK